MIGNKEKKERKKERKKENVYSKHSKSCFRSFHCYNNTSNQVLGKLNDMTS